MKVLSIWMVDPAASTSLGEKEFEKMNAFIAELRSSGVLIDTGGRSPDMLELTVTRKDGKTTVTDGPFTEAKELVGGFAILDVKDRDDAIALTNRFLDIGKGTATCHIHEVEMAP